MGLIYKNIENLHLLTCLPIPFFYFFLTSYLTLILTHTVLLEEITKTPHHKRHWSRNQKIAKTHRFIRSNSKNRRCIGYHNWSCSSPYFKMEREPVSERCNDKYTSGESQSVWYQENIESTLLRCINCSSYTISFLPDPSRRVHPGLESHCCNQGHNY